MAEWLAVGVGSGLAVPVVLLGLFGPRRVRASARAMLAVLASRGAVLRADAESVTSVTVTETESTTRTRTVAVSRRGDDARSAGERELD